VRDTPATDPRRRAHDRLDARRRDACDAGDHAAEADRARELLAVADPRATDELVGASRALLQALEHVALAAATDGARADAVAAWLAAATEAVVAIEERLTEEDVAIAGRRAALDPAVASLRRAEEATGLDPSPPSADLTRRERARGGPRPVSPGFVARHQEAIAALWARDGRAWWHERFVDRFGSEPPAGWWAEDPETGLGRVAPHRLEERWFDEADQAAFLAELEARYRSEAELPGRGEGRVSELDLARCVAAALPGEEIVRQARPPWLGARQSLDIYVPSLELAIEYQGEQHYLALAHWGGEAGLADRRELDERKRDACQRAGVRLVEWRYDEPVSIQAVRRRLGIAEGDRLSPT